MYYFLFALLFLVIVLGFSLISSYYGRLRADEKKLDKIKSKWGKPINTRRNFDLIKTYLNADKSWDRLPDVTAEDIDLKSIFNYIDRTSSKPGKQYLYKKLHFPETNLEKLLALDAKVESINKDKPNRELIELQLSKLNNTYAYYIADLFLRTHESIFVPIMNFYIRFVPLVIIALIVSLIVYPNPISILLLLFFVGYNVVLHYANKKKISSYTNSLPQLLIMHNVAVWLVKHAGLEDNEVVKTSLKNLLGLKRSLSIINLESKLINGGGDLSYAVFQLIKTLFLLEPRIYASSIKHIERYREDIELVYQYVAEIDMLVAIQSVRDGLPYYNKPQFIDTDAQMNITDLYHPLIDKCVTNSLYTRADKGALITGSNMSGKTTFIKAIAVNTLLAQTLFTSCTKEYKAPFLKIQTSIKTTDSIEEQKSYFQAQAQSILTIMSRSNEIEQVKSLVIIDEIFRGTNTIERIAAAKSVLSYITANQNFVFVSTHDLELAELLDEDFAIYSFEDSKSGAVLVFDYKLKEGLLKSRNGIAILESMGYPDSVIEDANIVSERMMLKYME
ncbi:MutS-related protein [Mucilaginibacter sp. 22184]|uniref:MutS-related protein n=1 Tax=Mucilaginibacter sp. 22184 TaxID=3453887 RepID=UPI003F82FC1C